MFKSIHKLSVLINFIFINVLFGGSDNAKKEEKLIWLKFHYDTRIGRLLYFVSLIYF